MVDFKIKSIEEKDNGDFIVMVETAYNLKRFHFKEDSKFLNVETNKPHFLHKIKKALEKKFENKKDTKGVVSKEFENYIGTTYDSDKLEDMSNKARNIRMEKRAVELREIKAKKEIKSEKDTE